MGQSATLFINFNIKLMYALLKFGHIFLKHSTYITFSWYYSLMTRQCQFFFTEWIKVFEVHQCKAWNIPLELSSFLLTAGYFIIKNIHIFTCPTTAIEIIIRNCVRRNCGRLINFLVNNVINSRLTRERNLLRWEPSDNVKLLYSLPRSFKRSSFG